MDDTRKIGLKEAIEVIRDLLREYLKRTGKLPETIVAVGETALAILRIRERSDDLDLYLSEVDDGAVDATVNRYRAKYGAQFKIDVTPANTLCGAFAVKDIEESPVTESIEIEGRSIQIRVLSPETMYLIKVAADRPKDRDDVPLIGKHCDYAALIARAKRLLPGTRIAPLSRSTSSVSCVRLGAISGGSFCRSKTISNSAMQSSSARTRSAPEWNCSSGSCYAPF